MQTVWEAVSDPNRRRVLDLLKRGEMTVSEIHEHFDITGASLSHHLKKLKEAGLVVSRRKGQHIFYAIQTSVFEDAAAAVAAMFKTDKE